jgi:multiple sugar transport system substrate-binding protein
MRFAKTIAAASVLAVASMTLGTTAMAAPSQLTLWTHAAGNPAELKIIQQISTDFNASQSKYKVVIKKFPQADYNESVVAAAASKSLPDILDLDGPNMPNWAWGKYIQPITVPAATLKSFLPGTQGVYNGKLYSLGLYDAAAGIFARKSVLDKAGVRVPTVAKPWTGAEFDAALAVFKKSGDFKYSIDMGTGWSGEWWPYGFSPFLQSFGGDLINRSNYTTAEGTLNGAAAVKWGKWFQGLFTKGYVNPKETGGREAFINGDAALQFNGNWAATDAYKKFGSDLLFLPTPDFGRGPKIGTSSWQWGVSSTTKNAAGANAWINFATKDNYLVKFSNAIGLIPATAAAAAKSTLYKKGSPYEIFPTLSAKFGLKRPPTPAYPIIAKAFEKAGTDIMNGADVQGALDTAVDTIGADLAANKNYKK